MMHDLTIIMSSILGFLAFLVVVLQRRTTFMWSRALWCVAGLLYGVFAMLQAGVQDNLNTFLAGFGLLSFLSAGIIYFLRCRGAGEPDNLPQGSAAWRR